MNTDAHRAWHAAKARVWDLRRQYTSFEPSHTWETEEAVRRRWKDRTEALVLSVAKAKTELRSLGEFLFADSHDKLAC